MPLNERYDNTAARHYAAFRPPLHGLILERALRPHEHFQVGLDVGCGAGASAVALARYCDRVLGLDCSRSMLDAAQPHPQVNYLHGSADALDRLSLPRVGVVSFAGSLHYAKTRSLRHGLASVCSPGGVVLAYDFEIPLDGVMAELGTDWSAAATDYDHRVNLADWPEFPVEANGTERLRLELTAREMAHLLLADSHRYDACQRRFPDLDPFESLVRWLARSSGAGSVDAVIAFTRHRVRGSE